METEQMRLQSYYQVSHHSQTGLILKERKSAGGVYNAWAASLPPRVTLNSAKLITIDWLMMYASTSASWFSSLALILRLVTSSESTWLRCWIPFSPFLFSYFSSLHPSLSVCFSPGPRFSLTLFAGIPMRRGDGGGRTPRSFPLRLPVTRALIGLNWKGINLGIWVGRLICTEYMERILVCVPLFDKGDEHTTSRMMHSAGAAPSTSIWNVYLWVYASSCVWIFM